MSKNEMKQVAILIFSLGLAGATIASAAPPSSGVLAVDCSGAYVRLAADDGGTKIVARGHLWDKAVDDRPLATSRFDGCLVADAVGDSGGRYLYAAIARQPFQRPDGTRDYRVVALRLPGLEPVASFRLDRVEEGPMSLMLSPGGEELLISFSRSTPRLLRLPTPGLQPPPTLLAKNGPSETEALSGEVLSSAASWIGPGRLVDGPRILDERGEVLARINPYDAFGKRADGRFLGLMRRGVAGKRYLAIAYAASAADKMLFVVNPDWSHDSEPAGAGVVVYDLESHQTVMIPLGGFVAALDPGSRATPSVHLTPDGEKVVVEGVEWRPGEGGEVRVKTGTLAIFDARTGERLGAVDLGADLGPAARVLGFSPDGEQLYYGTHREIFRVSLTGGQAPSSVDVGPGFDPYWTLGLAFWQR